MCPNSHSLLCIIIKWVMIKTIGYWCFLCYYNSFYKLVCLMEEAKLTSVRSVIFPARLSFRSSYRIVGFASHKGMLVHVSDLNPFLVIQYMSILLLNIRYYMYRGRLQQNLLTSYHSVVALSDCLYCL